MDVCAERGLFLANTPFQHKTLPRAPGRRGAAGGEERSLTDYIAVDERLRKDVLDASGERSVRRVRSLCCCG